MDDKWKNQNYDEMLASYKQMSALLFITGVILGSYVVLTSQPNIWMFIFTIGVVLYGAYSYFKKENGVSGYLLLGMGLIWTVAFVAKYLKLI
ncbi:hypothetical protein [Methanobacterium alcaliphilum]|uniref:hypothetical protein n=1 Tax=Methanobacterium alcaliphilum TaxID=392018 RepID=UPI00200B52E9|nr:hypothetical protein [Methanobacterium alcaliphilum]MCK9151039.1 hypothetical protein [Methanobacterium alcaliphilum]